MLERVKNYQQQFSVKVAQIEAPGLYKYYSTQRPVDIGTFLQLMEESGFAVKRGRGFSSTFNIAWPRA